MALRAACSTPRGALLVAVALCLMGAVNGLFFYVHKEVRPAA
jgi:hypothetical protein